ncbi:hypothetical protein GUJ93_ZPchr0010g8607 [Zizania palustris]|uniref:Uncharacterized protein n=1 Tax=Zizania palustris TaxID=103762 RepID=A0A8J6BE48_ZIZPA|nr:hypothetical protein GUJ93_ZPchr0010g8607 [Zizania palustris]
MGPVDHGDHERRPLQAKESVGAGDDGGGGMRPAQRASSQTYQSAADLAKLLPTGTVRAGVPAAVRDRQQPGHCLQANRAMAVDGGVHDIVLLPAV